LWQYTVMSSPQPANLRDRQTAATREQILDVAFEMLTRNPNDPFSHEAVAKKAGMGARTVYRYFPSRAELLGALWERLRGATGIRMPTAEEEVVPFIRSVFQQFENNEALIRAVLNSSISTEVRKTGAIRGRADLTKSLSKVLRGLPPRRQAQVIAVFLTIYSGPFWQTLRDRGGLSGPEAQEAAAWMLEVLLNAARSEAKAARQKSH
jgi:AcrR family transcriptional regulator